MAVIIPSKSRVVFGKDTKTTIRPASTLISASGGNSVNDIIMGSITYRVHTFTSSGILTVTSSEPYVTIEYICVAGGGGGSPGYTLPGPNNRSGGGGGAGGYLQSEVNIQPGTYQIVVGSAGALNVSGTPSFIGITTLSPYVVECTGGGRGGGLGIAGVPGGSGGGGGAPTVAGLGISGQGFPGGPMSAAGLTPSAGGGGGAGSAGLGAVAPGSGGAGKNSPFSVFPNFYAGGGGGGNNSNIFVPGGSNVGGTGGYLTSFNGGNAVINTGSGGGGGAAPPSGGVGGLGSSGIVLVRYRIS